MNTKLMLRIMLGLLLLLGLPFAGMAAAQQDDDPSARPWLGISVNDNPQGGARVAEVSADSPAEAAALQPEDVIIAIGETIVRDAYDLIAGVRAQQPGDSLTLVLMRAASPMLVEVTLAEAPADLDFAPLPERPMRPDGGPGNRFENMPGMPGFGGRMGSFMMVPGAVVSETDEGWLVERALPGSDFQDGDIITAVNGTPVAEVEITGLGALFGNLAQAGVEYSVQRGEESLTVTVEPGSGLGFVPAMPNRILLGVQFQAVEAGAQVLEVLPGSPAEAAGLQVDDVITAVAGKALGEDNLLPDALAAYNSGDTVTLSVQRGEESLELEVILEAMPSAGQRERLPSFPQMPFVLPEGFDLENLEDLNLDDLNLEDFGFTLPDLNLNLEDLDSLMQELDLPELAPGESASFACQNADGETVLSIELSVGEDGSANTNLSVEGLSAAQLPSLDLTTLDCQLQPSNSNDT